MSGMALRSAAKCFSDSASQYTMINFHLPPIAANAAVNGQPLMALGRCRRVSLPGGAFLIERIGYDYIPIEQIAVERSIRRLADQPRAFSFEAKESFLKRKG